MRQQYNKPQIQVIDMKCKYGYLQDGSLTSQEGNPTEIYSKKHTEFSFDDMEDFEEEEVKQ